MDSPASDPSPAATNQAVTEARDGQFAPASGQQKERRKMDRDTEMRISESAQFGDTVENRGLLESSQKLKPHEAQSYRKKALWVSWISILITLSLAVVAFRMLKKGGGASETGPVTQPARSSDSITYQALVKELTKSREMLGKQIEEKLAPISLMLQKHEQHVGDLEKRMDEVEHRITVVEADTCSSKGRIQAQETRSVVCMTKWMISRSGDPAPRTGGRRKLFRSLVCQRVRKVSS
ncbi:uncharacterized protein [Chiloscyllium punctatum]|uniref:uncharacterized protein isoform X3 n=1 Tax=Chiloscyllium punctatum TaxID=137246 RepID=UPI003B633C32